MDDKINNKYLDIIIEIEDKLIPITSEIDDNLGFWGRMSLLRGTVVKSMESDAESCKLGLWLFYRGKNAKTIVDETSERVNQTLQVEQ